MESKHRNILRSKRLILTNNIDSNIAIEHLYKTKVITSTDKEILNTIHSNVKKNEKLLDILPKRGAKAFESFYNLLKINNLTHILGDSCVQHDDDDDDDDDERMMMVVVEDEGFDCVPGPPPTTTTNGHHKVRNTPERDEKEAANNNNNQNTNSNVFSGHVTITEKAPELNNTSSNSTGSNEEPNDYGLDIVDTPHQLPKKPIFFENNLAPDRTDGAPSSASPGSTPSSASPQGAEGEDGPSFGFRKIVAPDKPDSIHFPITTEESDSYPMSKLPRGYFLLINNKEFLEESTMQPYPRNGTDLDAAAMESLFEELGYIVHAYKNQTCNQIRSAIKKLLNLDLKRVSCIACCFLSHGKEGVLYGTDGEIEIRDITSYFREKKDLVGKPKMFFFQACQGSDYMDGMQPAAEMEVDGPGDGSYSNDISLPSEADFLYAYSTVPGYYSWRNSVKGSWFIQGLVQVFRQHAHKMDVLRMLTRVNQIVSSRKSATGQHPSHNKRQICSIITQLRYELFLKPPHGPLKCFSQQL